MPSFVRLSLTAIAIAAVPALAGAQGWIIPGPCPVRPGMPMIACRTASIVRTRSDVRVELVGRVLRYEVDERFVNRGPMVGEADYVFPLPPDAAFQDLKLSINGELVAGETMNAMDARRIYEEIVRRQRDPALVEWMGSGMLRARIFPIAPGEEKRVVVRFQTVVQREGDAWRIDYMRGAGGGRGEAPALRDAGRATRGDADGSDGSTQSSFVLTYTPSAPLGRPYSPTHELTISDDGGQRRVEARGRGREVTILIPVRRSNAPAMSVVANAPGGEDGFALITVAPPDESGRAAAPRDITFVLDVSGSMAGRKLEQARAAGRQLLATLRPTDRFRMIDFSSDVHSFPGSTSDDGHDASGFLAATPANVRAAQRYLDALEAGGGTNLAAALDRALAGRRCDGDGCAGRVGIVLFITDGEPTIGERDPAAITAAAHAARHDQRIFTFGLGADVNAALLEQLALQDGGTAQFVRPEEDVERIVGITASRLVDPVLTDVRVHTAGDVELAKMLPTQPVDLFAGQDLVLLARYRGHGDARLVVEGRRGGQDVRWTTTAAFPEYERGNAFVPRLWATQRIGWLSAQKRMHPSGDSRDIDDEIRSLGERFGIPTEFTSYLVQEPCAGNPGACVAVRRYPGPVIGATGQVPPAQAFDAAKRASEMRAAQSVAAVDSITAVTVTAAAAAMGGTGNTVMAVRRVGDRTFILRDGRWTDARWREGMPVVRLQTYSPAYFELLQRLPELRTALSLGDRVLVAGRAVAVEVSPTAPSATRADLERLLRDW